MEYLTLAEAAALLGRPVYVIRYRIRRGQLRAIRRGRRLFLPFEDVIAWYQVDRQRPYRKQRRSR